VAAKLYLGAVTEGFEAENLDFLKLEQGAEPLPRWGISARSHDRFLIVQHATRSNRKRQSRRNQRVFGRRRKDVVDKGGRIKLIVE
jgi:hypothetical protein